MPSGGPAAQPPVPSQDSGVSADELIRLEKQRIERDNRRTDVMMRAFEFADAQDQRQFKYATDTRDGRLKLEHARLAFLRRIVWAALALGGVIGLALFYFAFFGEDDQRALVKQIVTPTLIAVAGYGFFAVVVRGIKSLSRGTDTTL